MQEHKPDLKIVSIKADPKKKIKLQRDMDFFQALSIKPILPNTIALGLGFFILYILNTPSLLPPMSKLIHNIATWSVYGLLFYQIIRSAFKSMALPLILILAAGTGFLLLSQHWVSSSWINPHWLQATMLIGIVGIFTFSVDIE